MKLSDNKQGPDKKFTCLTCGKEFASKKSCKSRVPKFCSMGCYADNLRMHVKCQVCGKEIENKHSVAIHNRVYCSKECQSEARRGISLPEEWKQALSVGRKASEKCKGKNLYNWKGGKETEPERFKISAHKRRSLQKIPLDNNFLKNLLIAQKNRCFYCDCDLADYKAIEHLTPLSRGGDNQIYNIMYSCKSCNSKKRGKTMEEYAIEIGRPFLVDKFDEIFAEALYNSSGYCEVNTI